MPTDRTAFVLLPGRREENDAYQLLQSETALAAGRRHGLQIEVSWAPAFDQLRTLKKRLLEPTPVDAVVIEPASVSTIAPLLRELGGRAGLVLQVLRLAHGGPVLCVTAPPPGAGLPPGGRFVLACSQTPATQYAPTRAAGERKEPEER